MSGCQLLNLILDASVFHAANPNDNDRWRAQPGQNQLAITLVCHFEIDRAFDELLR